MASDDDEIVSNDSVSFQNADIEASAPGRAFEALLQCDDNEQHSSLFSETNGFCRTPISAQSSIALLEAETLDKDHVVTDDKLFDQIAESVVEADDEQPSSSINENQSGDISPLIDKEKKIFESSLLQRHGNNRKHVFVLSVAGKPIFTRYGAEEDFNTLSGVLQALVSFSSVLNKGDELNYILAGRWKIVFLQKSPLTLVAASCCEESISQLRHQLMFVYHQILSVLTYNNLAKIYEQRKNFDFRRLLAGTERACQSLIVMTEKNPLHLLNAVKCHYLQNAIRESLGQTIVHYISKTKIIVFAILLANNQLLTMSRMKKFGLHALDLGLIINLVDANPSFKNVESWSPICLPRFDSSGFLHAHISYLTDNCNACLLLLTADKNAFFQLSEVKSKIVSKLIKNKNLQPLIDACDSNKNIKLSEVNIKDLWHFLYKNQTSSQYTCPDFEKPYLSEDSQKRLFDRYLNIHNYMHSNVQQLKIVYVTGNKESLLGWITKNFELYAVFSPLTSKAAAIGRVDKLMTWLKKEEEQLFILNPPLF